MNRITHSAHFIIYTLLITLPFLLQPSEYVSAHFFNENSCQHPLQKQPSEQKPLNAHVFVESTTIADSIDADPQQIIRKKNLSLIADFLLIDSQIRNVENTLSVFFYAERTSPAEEELHIQFDPASWEKTKRLIDNYHQAVDLFEYSNLGFRGIVNFESLFTNAALQADTEDGIPVVIILNDTANSNQTNDFAEQAYSIWQSGNSFDDAFIYMLDFTGISSNAQELWEDHFFSPLRENDAQGALRLVNMQDTLFILSRILEDATGEKIFQSIHTAPAKLPNCAFIKGFIYAEIADVEFGNSNNFTTASRLPELNGRILETKYAFLADVPSQTQDLRPNRGQHNILYAYMVQGNPPQLPCPIKYVADGSTINFQAVIEHNSNVVLRWGKPNDHANWASVAPHKTSLPNLEWHDIGPLTLDDNDLEIYLFSIENNTQKRTPPCLVSAILMPELEVQIITAVPRGAFEAEVIVENPHRLANTAPPEAEAIIDSQTIPFNVSLVSQEEDELIYAITANQDLSTLQDKDWELSVTLQSHTPEGVPINLQKSVHFGSVVSRSIVYLLFTLVLISTLLISWFVRRVVNIKIESIEPPIEVTGD